MKKERIEEIAELLDKRGKLTLEQLDEHFPNVSQMTIRRDLLQLEQEGRVIRVRGGAMSVKEVQKVSGESYTRKIASQTDENRYTYSRPKGGEPRRREHVHLHGRRHDGALSCKRAARYRYPRLHERPCRRHRTCQEEEHEGDHAGRTGDAENLSTSSPSAKMYFENTNFELAIISASAFTPEDGFSCGSQVEADLLILARRRRAPSI